MLIYACHDLASVEEVMRNVSLELPKIDEVQLAIKQAIDQTPDSYIRVSPIEWHAIEIKAGNISRIPVKVVLQIPNNDGLTYAQVTKKGQAVTIPTQSSSYHVDRLMSVDEILKQLNDIGVVLITLI